MNMMSQTPEPGRRDSADITDQVGNVVTPSTEMLSSAREMKILEILTRIERTYFSLEPGEGPPGIIGVSLDQVTDGDHYLMGLTPDPSLAERCAPQKIRIDSDGSIKWVADIVVEKQPYRWMDVLRNHRPIDSAIVDGLLDLIILKIGRS